MENNSRQEEEAIFDALKYGTWGGSEDAFKPYEELIGSEPSNKYSKYATEDNHGFLSSAFRGLGLGSEEPNGGLYGYGSHEFNSESLGLYDKDSEVKYSGFESFQSDILANGIQLPVPTGKSTSRKAYTEIVKPADNPVDAAVMFSVQTFRCKQSRSILVYQVPTQLETSDLLTLFTTYGDVEKLYCGRKKDLNVIVVSYFALSDAEMAMETLSSNSFPVEVQFCYNVLSTESAAYIENEIEDIMRGPSYFEEHKLLVLNSNKPELELLAGRVGPLRSIQPTSQGILVEFDSVRDCSRFFRESGGWSPSISDRVTVLPVPLEKTKLRLGNSLFNFIKGGTSVMGTKARAPVQERKDFSKLDVNAATFIPKPKLREFGRSSRRTVPTGSHPHHQQLQKSRHHSGRQQRNSEFVVNVVSIGNGQDRRTSVMIRNIPNKYTQKAFLEEVNKQLHGLYDFFYLPIDFKNKCNVGYAFLNVTDYRSVAKVYKCFNGRAWTKFNSDKVCVVSYAKLQGKDSLVNRFRNSSLMKKGAEFRPLLFVSEGPLKGNPENFPVGDM